MDNDTFEKIPNWLRYIIAVPVGIIGVIGLYFIMHIGFLYIDPDAPIIHISDFLYGNFFNIIIFLYCFNCCLPKHQFTFTVIISVIGLLLYGVSFGIFLISNTLNITLVISTLLGIIAFIISAIYSFKYYKNQNGDDKNANNI